MNKESAAAEIARIYRRTTQAGKWASIATLAEHTDMTPTEFAAGATHLALTDDDFNLAPESNIKMLTPMDRAYAVRLGGQDKHVVCWER